MRKLWRLLIAALLIAAMAGCGGEKPAETTVPTETTVPIETTVPVEEDVVYFSNELEMNRLYRVRTDGTDLRLVADVSCSKVMQQGDTVYYMDSAGLQAYHIPTGKTSLLVAGLLDYEIEGDYVACSMPSQPYYGGDLYCRSLTTGEQWLVATMDVGEFCFSGGYLYYVTYDDSTYDTLLNALYLPDRSNTVITRDYYGYYGLCPFGDGILLEAYGEQGGGYLVAKGADGTIAPLGTELLEDAQWVTPGSTAICYVRNLYSADETSLYLLDSTGEEKRLLTAEKDRYLYCSAIGPDLWLVEQIGYIGVGEEIEYGGYESYSTRIDYSLVSADGAVTPVEAAGENGKLFAAGDFPLIDSSTARKPVTAALYSRLCANFGYAGQLPICSTTHGAWLNIADRKVDLALLAAPTEEELAYLRQQGVEVEMKLYGGDGLVFIGNAANPVTDLTHPQILAIYRGEITNWSQVGGPDQPITVYYRDDQSGSQRLFESLVFAGEEIPNFEKLGFYIMDEMSTLVGIVLDDPYAIGYSIMTYLDEVYAEEQLQVFRVDGVAPSAETVKDASYPYHTKGYVVIRSDEPADSPARRLFNWFGCPASDDLLSWNSVTPLHEDE